MGEWVKDYVASCATFATVKTSRAPPKGELHPLPTPTRPWDTIGMDFIVKLPISQTFDSILVLVDHLTKAAHFVPCNESMTAPELADVFDREFVRLHGLPSTIVSDRGPVFTSKFWRRTLELLGTRSALTTAYHPEGNGQVERTNQTLETYLRAFTNLYHDNWSQLLSRAEIAMNNAISASTNTSPFYANYGYNARLDSLTATVPVVPAAENRIEDLHAIQQKIKATVEHAKATYKKFADRHRSPAPDLAVGDLVYLRSTNLQSANTSAKLRARAMGPFKILRRISTVTYVLDLPASMNIHPVFHVRLLEPVRTSAIPGRPVPPAPPAPVIINGEEHYEPEAILRTRLHKGTRQFLIKWLGQSEAEASWEPASDPALNPTEAAREAQFLASRPF